MVDSRDNARRRGDRQQRAREIIGEQYKEFAFSARQLETDPTRNPEVGSNMTEVWAAMKASPPPRVLGSGRIISSSLGFPAAGTTTGGKDFEGADLLVATTVDGGLHALDPTDGRRLWTFGGASPLISSYQAAPEGLLDSLLLTLIPALDGTLLVHSSEEHGLTKSMVDARQLLSRAPFVAPGEDGVLYTGFTNAVVYGLDANSGQVISAFDGVDVGDVEQWVGPVTYADRNIVWIGRVDRTVRAYDLPTGLERWNYTVGEWVPLDAAANSRERKSETSFGSLHSPAALSATIDNLLHYSNTSNGRIVWTSDFEHPVSSVFVYEGATEETETAVGSLNRCPVTHRRLAPLSLQDLRVDAESLDTAAIGVLESGQLYAFMILDEEEEVKKVIIERDRATLPRNNPRAGLEWDGAAHKHTFPLIEYVPAKVPAKYNYARCTTSHSQFPQCLLGLHRLIENSPVLPGFTNHETQVTLNNFPVLPAPMNTSSNLDLSEGPTPRLVTMMYAGWNLFSLAMVVVAILIVLENKVILTFFKRFGLLKSLHRKASQGRLAEEMASLLNSVDPLRPSSTSSTPPPTGPPKFSTDPSGWTRVGCLWVSERILGYGAHGTLVFEGLLEGRAVAVKRMLKVFHSKVDREIALLIESDGHPNVVRYFVREEEGEFVYLALQLCVLSLREAVDMIQQTLFLEQRISESDSSEKDESPTDNPYELLLPVPPAPTMLKEKRIIAPQAVCNALRQIAEGVAHLHSLQIVHRDLKPHNILLAKLEKDPRLHNLLEDEDKGSVFKSSEEPISEFTSVNDLAHFVLKISDMGLGKQLLTEKSSFSLSSFGRKASKKSSSSSGSASFYSNCSHSSSTGGSKVGSQGWQAPEIVLGKVVPDDASISDLSSDTNRRTQAVDVFSLGCIFYHVLVPGAHPFGEWYEREANIIKNAWDIDSLNHIPEAQDLVKIMITREPTERPTAAEVLSHPFFWEDEKKLAFLMDFSDRLEQEEQSSRLLLRMEENATAICTRAWDTKLDPALLEEVGKYRKYDTASVRDLLRLLRNKRHHFHELPHSLQEVLAPLPVGLYKYVEERFPLLLLHCYNLGLQTLCRERVFKDHFGARGATFVAKAEQEVAQAAAKAANRKAAGMTNPHVDDPHLDDIIVWDSSTTAAQLNVRGWWRHAESWASGPQLDPAKQKPRRKHIQLSLEDPKYRTRLCSHWEESAGTSCPMRRRGRCIFAHGPVELRVRENKRNRWGKRVDILGNSLSGCIGASGGEDTLGDARKLEILRISTDGGRQPRKKKNPPPLSEGSEQQAGGKDMGIDCSNDVHKKDESMNSKREAVASITFKMINADENPPISIKNVSHDEICLESKAEEDQQNDAVHQTMNTNHFLQENDTLEEEHTKGF